MVTIDCGKIKAVVSDRFSGPKLKQTIAFIASVLVLFLAITLVRVYLFDIDVVRGGSMEPTFEDGDVLFVRKYGLSHINRQDIVVVSWIQGLNQSLVKRVVAVPGDHVRIDEEGLYINDIFVATMTAGSDYFKMDRDLLENEYYLLGDNMMDSIDSRIFGPCVDLQIRGVVVSF